MEGLVEGEAGHSFAFGEIDGEVEREFEDAEEDGSGHEPDGPGVDEGMGSEGVNPESRGGLLFAEEAGEVCVAVFAEGEKFRLEGEVADGMGNEQGEENDQRGGRTSGHSIVGWQEGEHRDQWKKFWREVSSSAVESFSFMRRMRWDISETSPMRRWPAASG